MIGTRHRWADLDLGGMIDNQTVTFVETVGMELAAESTGRAAESRRRAFDPAPQST